MSLQTRYFPSALHAGPSDQSAPVHKRWIAALGWRRPSNAGSIVRTSGSVKYVVGAPRGLKSRGGCVIVLGGPTGALAGLCAAASRGANIAAPNATPTVRIALRRDVDATAFGTPAS